MRIVDASPSKRFFSWTGVEMVGGISTEIEFVGTSGVVGVVLTMKARAGFSRCIRSVSRTPRDDLRFGGLVNTLSETGDMGVGLVAFREDGVED